MKKEIYKQKVKHLNRTWYNRNINFCIAPLKRLNDPTLITIAKLFVHQGFGGRIFFHRFKVEEILKKNLDLDRHYFSVTFDTRNLDMANIEELLKGMEEYDFKLLDVFEKNQNTVFVLTKKRKVIAR